MKLVSLLMIVLFCGVVMPATAQERPQLDGFGVNTWGTSRNEIIETEGTPDYMFNRDGYSAIIYNNKIVMGHKATVTYYFEAGCTDLKSSLCPLSHGTYRFDETSKKSSDKIEASITKKYGSPTKAEKKSGSLLDQSNVKQGKKAFEYIFYFRDFGKTSINHNKTVSLFDYVDIKGTHEIGTGDDVIIYCGPYCYKIEQNKKRNENREF